MSYDVDIEVDAGGPEPMSEWVGNMTSNVAPMWQEAFWIGTDFRIPRTNEGGLYGAIHGRRAEDCIPDIDRAIHAMVDQPNRYERMNPENGWGSYEHALIFLVKIRDAARRYPRGTFRVSR